MMAESSNIFIPGSSSTAPVVTSAADGMQQSISPRKTCNTPDLAQIAAKIDSLKKWTISTYKTTKQSICENLGKVERTVDKELEEQIEQLKILHKNYNQVLAVSKLFTSNFHRMNETQKGLAESLYQLSLKEVSLRTECSSNCDSLRSVAHNGELLERALSFFLSSLKTLSEKTFEDTMETIHNYDQVVLFVSNENRDWYLARLEYDVHRNETAALYQSGASPEAIAGADFRCNQHRGKYEQLKADVKVKLRLLEENRLKVMRKQLMLLSNALTAYFSGNAKTLMSAMQNLNLDQMANDGVAPSFLEQ
uniref:AH domain-containing protein n=1 Tax=Setaria digitata TaxID=48799 RepID=A0A915Q2D3_9BILA